MRSINLIVIHCSATPNGVFISPSQIDEWHRQAGFRRDAAFSSKFRQHLPHIGYHRLVQVDGSPCAGRELEEIGAHVAGHNKTSIGVCMIGMDRFYLSQWEELRYTLGNLARDILKGRHPGHLVRPQTPTPRETIALLKDLGVRVAGHRDLSPDRDGDGVVEKHEWLKTCPNFDVTKWLAKGMEPEPENVFDVHPTIAKASPTVRALECIRCGPA
jgi:N-acetylmuramoyl-L-alanine amidase